MYLTTAQPFINSLIGRGFREFKPSNPGGHKNFINRFADRRHFILYGSNNKDYIKVSCSNDYNYMSPTVQIWVQKSSKYNCLYIENYKHDYNYSQIFDFSIKQIDFLLRNLF